MNVALPVPLGRSLKLCLYMLWNCLVDEKSSAVFPLRFRSHLKLFRTPTPIPPPPCFSQELIGLAFWVCRPSSGAQLRDPP